MSGSLHMSQGESTVDPGWMLRNRFLEATDEQCTPQLFGDIEPGDRFILWPDPTKRDSKYDEFIAGSSLYMKTELFSPRGPLLYSQNALELSSGTHKFFDDETPIIIIVIY